jgi:hypothetical protein
MAWKMFERAKHIVIMVGLDDRGRVANYSCRIGLKAALIAGDDRIGRIGVEVDHRG